MSRLSRARFSVQDPVWCVWDHVCFAFRVAAADGLVAEVPDFDDGWVQAGKVHDGHVEVHAWCGFDDDGALVFFAFNYCGCGGFAFFGEDVFGVWDKHVSFSVFAVHEVAYPSADALAADVFHGHAADAWRGRG